MRCVICPADEHFQLADSSMQLPPLPEPQHSVRRSQATGGICLVLSLITIFVGGTSWAISGLEAVPAITFAALIGTQAVVAFGCLAGLMYCDPGVVRRSQTNVEPVPDEVATRLAEHAPQRDSIDPMSGMSNLRDGQRSYCVRCYVWREHEARPSALSATLSCLSGRAPPEKVEVRVHHCRICTARALFDHHCGVFGRCIAGRGLQGNMWHS